MSFSFSLSIRALVHVIPWFYHANNTLPSMKTPFLQTCNGTKMILCYSSDISSSCLARRDFDLIVFQGCHRSGKNKVLQGQRKVRKFIFIGERS